MLEKMSLEEKARLTAGRDMMSTNPLPSMGVASIQMADGPMGVASTRVDERDVAYLTPCGTALGASWDVNLVRRVGELVGRDARRLGVSMMLAPNVNLIRSPLAGRSFEFYSEDPLLAGSMGVAWLHGLASRGVGAAVKHLVCNDSETHRDTMNVVVDERALREVYMLPFEMAVAAGCAGVLTAYNRVNGQYCCEHRGLITTIVKEEWGFDGFVVSDWFATRDTYRSAHAGLDLEMPGPARFFGEKLAAAVEQGEIPAARLDDAAKRMMRAAHAFPSAPADLTDEAADLELLAEAAAAGSVLLKNEGKLLPIEPGRIRRLALIGPNAANPCFQGGTFAKIGLSPKARSPLDAIRESFGGSCEVLFEPGVRPDHRLPPMPVKPTRDLGDGDRGVTVEFFPGHDFSGAPAAVETRNTNSLTWFGTMPGIGSIATDAGVRASGIFTPPQRGRYAFFAGGTGDIRMLVDGEEIYRCDQDIAPQDIMGVLKSGDADRVELELDAGRPVRVEIELRYRPARAQGLWFGIDAATDTEEMIRRAEDIARTSDAVILMLGETSDAGVESKDRATTSLPAAQIELIERIARANDRVALIANVAHAFDAPWLDKVQALLVVWYPGQEFGPALADVLCGKREPGGRLPLTFARRDDDYQVFGLAPDENDDLHYLESWRIGYRSFTDRGVEPLFAFGAGTGYAEFEWSDFRITHGDANLTVSVLIKNVADRAGKEVVQVYVGAPDAPHIPQLKGFQAVHLHPGEQQRVMIELDARAFAMWDVLRDRWSIPAGKRTIAVGRALRDIRFSRQVEPAFAQAI